MAPRRVRATLVNHASRYAARHPLGRVQASRRPPRAARDRRFRADTAAAGRRPARGRAEARPTERCQSRAGADGSGYHSGQRQQPKRGDQMAEYIPSPRQWVRDQVDLYERSGGKEGTTLRDTGLPVIIVTNRGNKTGAIRKTPLMRVKDGARYVLVGSMGGAPTDPVWVHNLRAQPAVEIRDLTVVQPMRVREVKDEAERARLWAAAVAAFQPYAEYQPQTPRTI